MQLCNHLACTRLGTHRLTPWNGHQYVSQDGRLYFCLEHVDVMTKLYHRYKSIEEGLNIGSMTICWPGGAPPISHDIAMAEAAGLSEAIDLRRCFQMLLNITPTKSYGHQRWILHLNGLLINRVCLVAAHTEEPPTPPPSPRPVLTAAYKRRLRAKKREAALSLGSRL
jgi:hypothetical protein